MEINMKQMVIIMLILFTGISLSQGAEVMIDLPPKPTNSEINSLMRNKDLFASKVLEYYTIAVMLKAQLDYMNVDSDISVPTPSLNDLSFRDKKVLIRYYSLILKIKDLIIQQPESPDKERIADLRNRILASHRQIDSLNSYIFEMRLQNQHIDFYKDNMNRLIEKLDILIVQLDSMHVAHIDDLMDLRNSIISYYEFDWRYNDPFAEVGLSGNMFLANGYDLVDNKPSLGVIVAVNLYKLFGWWSGLYVWYEHINPLMKTSYLEKRAEFVYLENTYEWKSNLSALGFSQKFYFNKDADRYRDGLRIAAGYFWSSGTIYNFPGEFNFHGGRLDLEYFAGNFGLAMPIEAFMVISLYHSFNKDLIFHHGTPDIYGQYHGDINTGKTHIAGKLGIRLNLHKLPF
jgi:hypothetical protein